MRIPRRGRVEALQKHGGMKEDGRHDSSSSGV